MKKRILALIVAIVVIAASLSACGGSSGGGASSAEAKEETKEESKAEESKAEEPKEEAKEEAPAEDKILIRMIDSLASETRTNAIQAIIDKYMEENPNIEVELISPPTEGADTKIQNMLNSDEQLDIFDTGNQFIAAINNGWVAPLNDYMKDWDEYATLSDAAKGRMTCLSTDGETMYCIPYGIYQRLLFYRTDLLGDAGVTVPELWTYDDWYNIGKQVTDPSKGIYGVGFRGGTRGFNVYDNILLTFIGDDLCENENYRGFLKDGTSIYRTQEAKDALEFYKKVYEECSPQDSIAWGFTEMVQGFMSGQCGTILQDNDVIQSCEDGLDDSVWAVANYPIGPSGYGSQPTGYGGWALTEKCEHKEEAVKFMEYLSSAENNGAFCRQTGLIPIHTTTIEQDDYFSSGHYSVFNQMDATGKYRVYTSLGLGYSDLVTIDDTRDEYLQKYLQGEVSAEDLLDNWATPWEEAYKERGQLW